MRRIGLFGGSFNPPHVAHQLVALYVLETLVDEVWIVPTFAHPFGKDLAPYDDRVEMCKLATIALGARAVVSRAEAELARRPGFVASRTLDLIDHVAAQQPDVELRLVIGSDILGETAKWHRWDEVVRRAPPIVVARAGYPTPDGGPVLPDISATRGRERIAAGDDAVHSLVPTRVLGYIASHQLYR